MPSVTHTGPHELGQNFLIDRSVVNSICQLIARTTEPIVEIGPGDGALTVPLTRLGRSMTVVEIDPRRARRLLRRLPDHVTVVNQDILRYRLPRFPHVIVGNLPFHITTAIMKHLLAADTWQQAVLVVQWEVARRRAGVGAASMLTAQWWPWYEFALHARIPAQSFRPVPSVDGGLVSMTRRPRPLVAERARYQRFVRTVFTGRGRGIREILLRTGHVDRAALGAWLRRYRVAPQALPKDLSAEHWATLWQLTAE